MTDMAIGYRKRAHERSRQIKNGIVGWGSAALIFASIALISSFVERAWVQQNEALWEYQAIAFGVGASVLYTIACIWFAAVDKTQLWSWIETRTGLSPVVSFLASLAIIPIAVLGYIQTQPHFVTTPEHYIRVMDDGRLAHAGELATGTRWRVSSTLVPLNYTKVPLWFTVRGPDGDIVVSTDAVLVLRPGNALDELLVQEGSAVTSNPERYFAREAQALLSPVATALVAELKAGKTAEPTVRFTQLMAEHAELSSGRFRYLAVSNVRVAKGERSL